MQSVIVEMALLGLHFMLLDLNFDLKNLQWLPILALVIFMLLCIGLLPVPNTLLSELFPADLKSTAGFIGSIASAIFAFAASKSYQPMGRFVVRAMSLGLLIYCRNIPSVHFRQSTENLDEDLAATLLLLQIGLMAGWSSPYLFQLTSQESILPITMDEASWVASLLNFGRLFGAVAGSVCVYYLGSKTTILITSTPIAVGWVLMTVANDVAILYSSRLLCGIGMGMTYSCFSLYLAEIAHPSIRGALVALGMSGLSIGNLLICLMAVYWPVKISASVSLALCLILTTLFAWLPESPHHFIKMKQCDKAKSSILWYQRGCDVELEFLSIRKFVESLGDLNLLQTLKEFRIPQVKRALVIITVLFMYSQMCGINIIVLNMEIILRSAQVTAIEPSILVMIVVTLGFVGSCMSVVLIDVYGRKLLMIISCLGGSISLFCLGIEFQLLNSGYDPKAVQLLTIFAVNFFFVSVFLGVLPMSNAMLSEIFPPHVKYIAAGYGSMTAGIFSFLSAITYQPLVNSITEQYIFYIYTLILASGIPFALFVMPETKGKSLQEIQEELMSLSRN